MKKKNKFWNMEKTSETTATINIYGEIGESFWGDSTSASSFARELSSLGDNIDELIVCINSPGGSVFDGLAIRSTLVNHPAKVLVRVEGWAASIASVIAMAGDEIEMALGSMMMIHNPLTFSVGEAKDLRKVADVLDQVRDSLVDVYEARTGINRDEIIDMLDAETWMDAQTAVEKGFADRVEVDDVVNIVASAEGLQVNGVSMPQFKNAPVTFEQPKMAEEPIKNTLPPAQQAQQVEEEKGDEDVKTVEELMNKYPELVNEIVENAQKEERERMKNIEEIAKPGFENLVEKAKYEEPSMTAESLAIQMIKQEKEASTMQMQNIRKDAKVLEQIGNTGDPLEEPEKKTNTIANLMNKMRGGQ